MSGRLDVPVAPESYPAHSAVNWSHAESVSIAAKIDALCLTPLRWF